MEIMKTIEINHLNYSYPNGITALKDISFSIDERERVGLIGPNGAGKSTLIWHLNGILPEKAQIASSVSVMGIPVLENNLPTIRSMVGLLFQDPDDQLFMPTVYEDIAFGPKQMGKNKKELSGIIHDALSQVGLVDFESRQTNQLSQGEKRRVCIAGLLACDARILALDEPTSGLDPRGRRELKDLLRKLPVTQLIATHDLELVVEVCSRVIVIDHGQIIIDGPVVDILNNEKLMLDHGLERPHILRHLHPH
jgi:energy-coupling factor transporter ATP-binding protein EcfA2